MPTPSFARSIATGSTATYSVPFGYLDKSHVNIYLNDVLQTVDVGYTWLDDANIQFAGGNVAAGTVVLRKRQTPTDLLVSFTPGNLSSEDLNTGNLQPLYLAQEARDGGDDLAARAWVTKAFGPGGTIEKGVPGQVAAFDGGGNLVPASSVGDDISAAGTAGLTVLSKETIAEIRTFLDVYDKAQSRRKLTANTNFFVDGASGSDVTGDGSIGFPWATLQHAFSQVMALDIDRRAVEIFVEDGSYAPLAINQFSSVVGPGLITLTGSGPTVCSVGGTASAIQVASPIPLRVQGFAISSTAGFGIEAQGGGARVFIVGDMHWYNSIAPFYATRHGYIQHSADTRIKGTAFNDIIAASHYGHFRADSASQLWVDSDLTLDASVGAAADADNGDIVFTAGAIIGGSGSITGKRWEQYNGGLIQVGGLNVAYNANFFPGTIPGSSRSEMRGYEANAGAITTAAIGTDTDNWSPVDATSGLPMRHVRTVFFSSSAPYQIRGLLSNGIKDGQVVTLCNIGGFSCTLKKLAGTSVSANQFAIPADIAVPSLGAVSLRYSSQQAFWRPAG